MALVEALIDLKLHKSSQKTIGAKSQDINLATVMVDSKKIGQPLLEQKGNFFPLKILEFFWYTLSELLLVMAAKVFLQRNEILPSYFLLQVRENR